MNRLRVSVFLFGLVFLLFAACPASPQTLNADYFSELGISFYHLGRYNEALYEFEKALTVNPQHKISREYINKIYQETITKRTIIKPPEEVKVETISEKDYLLQKRDSIELTLQKFEQQIQKEEVLAKKATPEPKKKEVKKETKKEEGKEGPKLKLSGKTILSLGFTSDDIIWKDANADRLGIPMEKNWRYLWGKDRHNTYDAEIFDRLRLNMETEFDSPLNAFMEITIDPWTFVGKTHVTVERAADGDVVDADLKYWSADKRTINETYRSKQGKIVQLKQIKVDDNKTSLSGLVMALVGTEFASLQPTEINRQYRPIRKLWFDYKQDNYSIKVFPLSDQLEALTTDDPMIISNAHLYWEESPWLDEYEPSRLFEKDNNPIKKGRWIRRLSFFTKESKFGYPDYPERLTFLRGISFKTNPGAYSLQATIASPMSLWDEYYRSNSINAAARLNMPFQDDFQFGLTATSKIGINGGSTEAWNQVGAGDISYLLDPETTLFLELAGSETRVDEAKGFTRTFNGLGVKAGFNFETGEEKSKGLYASKLWMVYMDDDFYPGLSNYRYTRRDFYSTYFEEQDPLDIPHRIGDSVDRGRAVIGFQGQAKLRKNLDTLFNIRRAHKDSGSYVETISRLEALYEATERLDFKFIGWYKHLPKTYAGYDPLFYAKTAYSLTDYFSEDDHFLKNDDVLADKDPSIGRFGLGAKYDIDECTSWIGIYERTNDPLDFPRGILTDTTVLTEHYDGQYWDRVEAFLYDQAFFDLPPYDYYNIFKTKLIFRCPDPLWEVILRYTYNENKHAAGLTDDINHVGLEASLRPNDKWRFWLKYIWSRVIDVYKQNKHQRSDFYEGHHNVFLGAEYKIDPNSSFTILYGEFVAYDDPYQQAKWSLSALDTQHLIRVYYKRKF